MGTLQTIFSSSQALSQCLLFMHRKAAATATVAGKLRTRGRQCRQANRPGSRYVIHFRRGRHQSLLHVREKAILFILQVSS